MKKKFYKKWWFWLIVVILIISFLSRGDDKPAASDTNKPVPAVQASETPSDTTPSPSTAAPKTFSDLAVSELTKSNIKEAISDANIKNKVTDVKIEGGTVTVIVYDKDYLTIKTYLKQNQPDSASVFKDLFKNKNITTVVYQSDVSLTDTYGGEIRETAQTNTMKRADADKVTDWNTFAYESMSQYYSVVTFDLAPESKVNGLHKAWSEIYN